MNEPNASVLLADIDVHCEPTITNQTSSLFDSETEDVLSFLARYKHLTIQRSSDTHYRFFNRNNEQCFFVVEKSQYWHKVMIGRRRAIEYTIYDNNGVEALFLERPCFWCWPKMSVYTPKRNLYVRRLFIGRISQKPWTCRPIFNITNLVGRKRLRIKGSCFHSAVCCCPLRFEIQKIGKAGEIGVIRRELQLPKTDCRITDLNHLGCRFPKDLKYTQKALLMALTLLIHSKYVDGFGR